MKPLVSICIPTYNRAELVQRAITCAQQQTYPNIEIIVSDNCSTDNTEEIVHAIAQKDNRVRYIRNATNVGPTRNWQIAVNAARGEFCKILFSDDQITVDFVSCCINEFFKGHDVAFVLTDGIVGKSFEDGILWNSYRQPSGISPSKEYILNYLMWDAGADSPACALFRTADLVSNITLSNPHFEIDNYTQNGAGPDCLIFLNTALSHSEIAYISKPLTFFRSCGDSISYQAHLENSACTRLLNCYAKARYHFLRNLTVNRQCLWYLRYLSTLTGAVRQHKTRSLLSCDLKLKNKKRFSFLDFVIGCILRQFKYELVRPRLKMILAKQ